MAQNELVDTLDSIRVPDCGAVDRFRAETVRIVADPRGPREASKGSGCTCHEASVMVMDDKIEKRLACLEAQDSERRQARDTIRDISRAIGNLTSQVAVISAEVGHLKESVKPIEKMSDRLTRMEASRWLVPGSVGAGGGVLLLQIIEKLLH